jgi:hypothetical protein
VNRLFSALGVLFIGLMVDEAVRRLFQSRTAMRTEYRQRYRERRRRAGSRELKKEQVMLDLVYIVIVLAFFAVAAAYTRGCDRL